MRFLRRRGCRTTYQSANKWRMTAIVATAKPTSNTACLMVRTATSRNVPQGAIVDVKWSRAVQLCLAATFIRPAGLGSRAFVRRYFLSRLWRSEASSASQKANQSDHCLILSRWNVPDPGRYQAACLFFPHWSSTNPGAYYHFVCSGEPGRRFRASRTQFSPG